MQRTHNPKLSLALWCSLGVGAVIQTLAMSPTQAQSRDLGAQACLDDASAAKSAELRKGHGC